jgi:hypothetical protein
VKQFTTRARWVANFGGLVTNANSSIVIRTLLASLVRSPDYSAVDVIRTLRSLKGRTGGTAMQIAKGLHRIGSDTVNSYLVIDRDGVTIIDAGLPRYWKLLGTERLYHEKGILAYLHPADAGRARLEVKKPNSGWGPVKAAPLAGFLWYSARHVHLPGHTPGSVAVHVPAADALFIGDTITTRNVLTGATGPKPAPFTLEPEQALASLEAAAR